MEDAPGDLELVARVVDLRDLAVARHHARNLATQGAVRLKRGPVEAASGQDARCDGGKDVYLRAQVTLDRRCAALREPHEVEHRLLRGGLCFLVPREYGQDDRGLSAAMDMALV